VRLFQMLRRRRPSVVVLEGTGLGGGVPIIFAGVLFGQRYVVSSGDPVSVFVSWWHPSLRLPALAYEALLYRLASGFIGWSPYMVGRALTFGARRAITAAGWAPDHPRSKREVTRARLKIPPHAIVFGLVGSLHWNKRFDWCMGAELVRAARIFPRRDVYVLIVGDGSGTAHLAALCDELDNRVVLLGRVPQEQVGDYLAAMDVAVLPHSSDSLGRYRYTTKISEYIASNLPIVSGRGPAAYDLGKDWIWRLPGKAPWDPQFVESLGLLMRNITEDDIAQKRRAMPTGLDVFDMRLQQRRVGDFIKDLLAYDNSGPGSR
jgi:glycosyltransferase involved in cell wall biosynthesis